MKIYHTETQADYDALMVELEAEGIETLQKEYWPIFKTKTTVVVRAQSGEKRNCGNGTTYGSLSLVRSRYDIPIVKYKAKADERMRFTKENVKKVIDEYFWQVGFESCGDLIAEIRNLDDTPEKVVVPKCFDEWYKEIEADHQIHAKTFALWKLCQQGFGKPFERVGGQKITYDSDLGEWLFKNKTQAIDAVLNGYTIEPEPLYVIPLENLVTSDGVQQYLSYDATGQNYFASRPRVELKQEYTKDELQDVPEGVQNVCGIVGGRGMKIIKHQVKTYAEERHIGTQLFSTKEKAMEEVEYASIYRTEYTGEVEIDLFCESCDKDLTLQDEYIKTDDYTRYCSDCYEENSVTYYTVGGEHVGDENDVEEYAVGYPEAEEIK